MYYKRTVFNRKRNKFFNIILLFFKFFFNIITKFSLKFLCFNLSSFESNFNGLKIENFIIHLTENYLNYIVCDIIITHPSIKILFKKGKAKNKRAVM